MNTETKTANDVLELYCVASAMGCVPVRRLIDVETGEGTTFACIRGVPIPYGRFLSIMLGVMTETDDRSGQNCDVFTTTITPLWARVKLGAKARQYLEEGHPVLHVGRKLVRMGYHERVKTPGSEPAEEVKRFIRELEEAHAEAMEDPIQVTGLTALSAPLILAAPWSEGARKAEMKRREEAVQSTAAAWKKLDAQNAAQSAAQSAAPEPEAVLVPPTPASEKAKEAARKVIEAVRKAQSLGICARF